MQWWGLQERGSNNSGVELYNPHVMLENSTALMSPVNVGVLLDHIGSRIRVARKAILGLRYTGYDPGGGGRTRRVIPKLCLELLLKCSIVWVRERKLPTLATS